MLFLKWQTSAGLLQRGVGHRHACSGIDRGLGRGIQSFGPGNHRNCTLNFKQDLEPGVGLQGVL